MGYVGKGELDSHSPVRCDTFYTMLFELHTFQREGWKEYYMILRTREYPMHAVTRSSDPFISKCYESLTYVVDSLLTSY